MKEIHQREEEVIHQNSQLKAALEVGKEKAAAMVEKLQSAESELAKIRGGGEGEASSSGEQMASLQAEVDNCLRQMSEERERFAKESGAWVRSSVRLLLGDHRAGMGKFLKSQPVPRTPGPQRLRNCRSSPVPNYLLEKYPVQVPLPVLTRKYICPDFLRKWVPYL